MEKDVKSEATSEVSLSVFVDGTSDVARLNKIKTEYPHFKSHAYCGLMEHAVMKYEDASIESLNLKVKSEVSDLKCDTESGNDDICIELKPLVGDELHIKSEVEESLPHVTMKKSTRVEHFYCDFCNSKFELEKKLQRHIKIHAREKPFKCILCNYTCMENSHLRRHMKIHTGEKPFKCNICCYRFIQKSDLQRHNKTHTGEKPFQCNVCDYKCTQKSTLQRHTKIHTREMPFKCNICGYSCIQKISLLQHLKTHAGERQLQ